jgi:hypothetical protein
LPAETLTAVFACLRRLAVDSVGPSRSRYDQQRDLDLPASLTLCRSLGVSWNQIAEDAGLRVSGRAAALAARQRAARAVPDEVENFIREAFGLGLHIEDYRHVPEGFATVPASRRVEVFEVEHGGVRRRIERETVMLR